MDNGKAIQRVSMELIEESGGARYCDGDIAILDSQLRGDPSNLYQLDMLMMAFCAKGKVQMDLNGATYRAAAGDIIVCPPGTLIENVMISPDMDCKALGLSNRAIQHSLHVGKNLWNMILYVVKNPVIHLDGRQQLLMGLYHDLLRHKVASHEGHYQREVMQSLFQAMFYELCSVIRPNIEERSLDAGLKQGDLLFKRFLRLLGESDGRERSVRQFAHQLNVTPKYLSTVSKNASGKTALQWIHEHSKERIVRLLRHSDLSIKEIANELNFPNLSFFGKFVKAHLGMSPSEFRKRGEA